MAQGKGGSVAMLIFVGAYGALAAGLYFILLRSPQGYEDHRGFHYGTAKPEPLVEDSHKVSAPACPE